MAKHKSNSRAARWSRAVTEARGILDQIETLMGELIDGPMDELRNLKGEYEEWQCNLPENFQSSPLGEKLQAVVDLDLDAEELTDILNVIEEADSIELPLGFGRD